MEKAILRTLIYADIFDYPLTIREIHKWLIKEKTNLRTVESAIKRLIRKGKIEKKRDYYFLVNRKNLANLRAEKNRQSERYFKKIETISQLFKIIPFIKLVGISGGLAMNNAGRGDDIDLFIITSKRRLWTSRILILGILELLGLRRKRTDGKRQAAGKICCNILIEEDKLLQSNQDIYTAHEVLQMKVIWEREGIYQKYLEDNSWAFEYLPNWITNSGEVFIKKSKQVFLENSESSFLDLLENLFSKLQLKIMGKSKGAERIEKGLLYFHPDDYRQKVLNAFKKTT